VSLLLGVKFAPKGESWSLGEMMTPLFSPMCEHSLGTVNSNGGAYRGSSSPGDNFTPRGQLHPVGTTSPLGDNFTPRGQSLPLGTTSPLGDNFTPRGQLHPLGTISPLGDKVYSWGTTSPPGSYFAPGVKLKTGQKAIRFLSSSLVAVGKTILSRLSPNVSESASFFLCPQLYYAFLASLVRIQGDQIMRMSGIY
jgi:hypothetical protein